MSDAKVPNVLQIAEGPVTAERYRLLVESVTDYAIYMLDPQGIVISWNPGARRFKGYEDHEIIGQSFSRFYTEEDRAAGLPARALRQAAEEGRFEKEGWRIRKDGTRFWAHVVIDPILNPATGRVLGYAKVTRDLTERREADQALRRSEERFRLLVQGVTDYAIYMIDRDGVVTNWNAGAQRIKGYCPDEIVGRHFSLFYQPADRANGEPERALQTAIDNGSFEKEGWRLRKNGEAFWAHVVIDPIRDDGGEIIGFAKITRDLTERHKVQAELDAAREALFQAQKIEALGQLTGGVAHDFNNLLTAVLGSLELVRRQIGDERQLGLIDNAIKGASRGISLTQRMLSFARKQELELKPVAVDVLVAEMGDLLQRSLGPLIRIETDFPADLVMAAADPNQLETAVLNLAVNARDAMPEGGVLRIRGSNERVGSGHRIGLPAGRYVRLSVGDTGSGMDARTLAQATEPFFTTKGVGKGTGLGLSMVHGMAEQLGGRLLLDSRLGQGTTVEIWLPAATAAIAAEPAPRPVEPKTEADMAPRPLTVLAVDDDALVLMNTTALLEDLGHRVIEASSGREALAALEGGEAIDLLITDHAMPQMTGAQLIAEVGERWPALPVILATGYADLPAGARSGVLRLNKPFWQADLEKAVAAAMARRATAAAA
ncbi:hybrid sensor histidine kinase/response regulator [Bosea sp. Tri-39]|nr:hybrid sensor histidine kinase/response regulator [Bosea sp. Tri-49]RXT27423.1 hybrid sensor histidine kinase/response regulator [Bosea sp. Tri-39]RXT35872.1 hybrid sensor histidine kinase/response regulator [Bosea sp. Tri-54]